MNTAWPTDNNVWHWMCLSRAGYDRAPPSADDGRVKRSGDGATGKDDWVMELLECYAQEYVDDVRRVDAVPLEELVSGAGRLDDSADDEPITGTTDVESETLSVDLSRAIVEADRCTGRPNCRFLRQLTALRRASFIRPAFSQGHLVSIQ